MAREPLDAEEIRAGFSILVRSATWLLFLREAVVPEARAARSALMAGRTLEDLRAAQARLAQLKTLVEYPYRRARDPEDSREAPIPADLASLWDP